MGSIDLGKYKILIDLIKRVNSACHSMNALYLSISEGAMRLVNCQVVNLIIINEYDGVLRFVFSLELDKSFVKNEIVNDRSIASYVMQNNRSLVINDVKNDARFFDDMQDNASGSTKSILAVPISINGKCFAVLELLNKIDNAGFSGADAALLDAFCTHIAIAYQNTNYILCTKQNFVYLHDFVMQNIEYDPFIATSRVSVELLNIANNVAKTNSCILITGENGVGKNTLANFIYLKSMRANKAFVKITCMNMTDNLFENVFFNEKNINDVANGGTLLLLEINLMPISIQYKLLDILKTNKFINPITKIAMNIDCRIIATTSKNLEVMSYDGVFLKDLYYRLNVLPLNICPLRNRKEDIIEIARFFLAKYSVEVKKDFIDFSSDAITMLCAYYWSGNVAELKNIVERACIIGTPPYIYSIDLNIDNCTDFVFKMSDSALSSGFEMDKTLHSAIHRFKRSYILQILKETRWNQTQAAKILAVQRTYVSRLLNELNIRGVEYERS